MLPKENYKYIPLLLLEFRLNPYAFFTSGPLNTDFKTEITT